MTPKVLFIPDAFGAIDLDYLQSQATSHCRIEFLGERKEDGDTHGDYCTQAALRAARHHSEITHLFLCDRRKSDWLDVARDVRNDFPDLNVSISFGTNIHRGNDMFGQAITDIVKENARKVSIHDGGLWFCASGNFGDANPASDLVWPQANWADRFHNVFLIAACDRERRIATFTSQSNGDPGEGVISITAPGVGIEFRHPRTGRPERQAGTSFSTPLVAGDATSRGLVIPQAVKESWEARLTIHKSWYDEWLAGEHHKSAGRGILWEESWFDL